METDRDVTTTIDTKEQSQTKYSPAAFLIHFLLKANRLKKELVPV